MILIKPFPTLQAYYFAHKKTPTSGLFSNSKSHDGSMAIDINIYRFMNAYGKLVDKYTSPMDPSRLRIPTFHDFS